MKSDEKKVCAQATVLNCVGLQVEGNETAVTYVYKLFKTYLEKQKSSHTLCKKSIVSEPLAVKGQHENLLCLLIKSSDQLNFTSTLNGFGVDFNLVASEDVPFAVFVVSEPVAAERAVQSSGTEIVSFCYLSVKDNGLPETPEIESESESLGIVRGVGKEGYITAGDYWEECMETGRIIIGMISKATPQQLEQLRMDHKTVDELAEEAKQYETENGPVFSMDDDGRIHILRQPDAPDELDQAGFNVMNQDLVNAVRDISEATKNVKVNFDPTIDTSVTLDGLM